MNETISKEVRKRMIKRFWIVDAPLTACSAVVSFMVTYQLVGNIWIALGTSLVPIFGTIAYIYPHKNNPLFIYPKYIQFTDDLLDMKSRSWIVVYTWYLILLWLSRSITWQTVRMAMRKRPAAVMGRGCICIINPSDAKEFFNQAT